MKTKNTVESHNGMLRRSYVSEGLARDSARSEPRALGLRTSSQVSVASHLCHDSQDYHKQGNAR